MTLQVYDVPEGWVILGATIRHRGGVTEEVDAEDIVVVPAAVTPAAQHPTTPSRS